MDNVTRGYNINMAKKHEEDIKTYYGASVKSTLDRTCIYGELDYENFLHYKDAAKARAKYDKTRIILSNDYTQNVCMGAMINQNVVVDYMTSEQQFPERMWALNFASFKHPGGKYIEGSMAQEEALCHNSSLYQCLTPLDENFYAPHRKGEGVNKGLYSNTAIVSPDVIFTGLDIAIKRTVPVPAVGVITCAAPNRFAAQRNKVPVEEINQTMRSRLDYILALSTAMSCDSLVLGAYGCGVFRNNPYEVAAILADLLKGYEHCFKYIFIAIPDIKNYKPFENEMIKLAMENPKFAAVYIKPDKWVECSGTTSWDTIM